MANRYAVASGNWSSTATWDGGTLPTSADIVRPNNFNVTIDQNITVQALRNDAVAPAVAGGTFTLTGDFTVNISLDIQCFASDLFTYNGTGTAYITGVNSTAAIISSTTTSNTNTVIHSGTGHLIVDMVMNSTILNEVGRTNLYISGGGTLTCLKEISSTFGNSSTTGFSQTILVANLNGAILNLKNVNCRTLNYAAVRCNSQCILNINGDVTMSNYGYSGGTSIISTIITSVFTEINIVGNILADTSISQNQQYRILSINANSTININGNISGISGNSSSFGASVFIASGISNITITGNVSSASSGGGVGVNLNQGSFLNLTGNVTALSGSAIFSLGTVSIIGTITGGLGNGVIGINIGGGTLNHIGVVQASAFASAIYSSVSSAVVNVTGPFISNGYTLPLACQSFYINSAYNPSFTFRNTVGVDMIYIESSSLNFPITSNVRQGITYGGGFYTGTLIMAAPSNVSLGIPTDATIGTAEITAADFLTTLSTSLDPLAVRLRNVSTVASIGQQLASYNI